MHDDFAYVHPEQDAETIQGILEIFYKFEQIMKKYPAWTLTFQPGGGNHAVYCAASVMIYHESRETPRGTLRSLISLILAMQLHSIPQAIKS